MSTEMGKTKKKKVTAVHGLSTRILTPDYFHCMSTEKLGKKEEEKKKVTAVHGLSTRILTPDYFHCMSTEKLGKKEEKGYSSSWPQYKNLNT